MDAGLEGVSNLCENALNQGNKRNVDFKRENELSQQSRMESVKLEQLRKVSGASHSLLNMIMLIEMVVSVYLRMAYDFKRHQDD